MLNALTIDVEDYYMVSAFADRIKFEDWCTYECRVERNTQTILDMLDQYGVKATFFVLGWVAERYPELIRNIHRAGHEIASHGYNHRLVYDLTPKQFREDIRTAKDILENITGAGVKGYRATSYSIVKETLWALDSLIEEGFQYDSSIFPIHHDRYGMPDAARFPHVLERQAGRIMEFPPTTYRLFGQNIPVAGGGYLRLLPHAITRAAIKCINEREKKSAIVYFHPWEIDVDQPRINGKLKSMIRHYINLNTTMPKLRNLLSEFAFRPIASLLDAAEPVTT